MTLDNKKFKDDKEEIIFSKPSQQLKRVGFINLSERKAAVIWIDFKGKKVSYKILLPQQKQDVSTFVDHVWIFEDVENGERLVTTNGEKVLVIPNTKDSDIFTVKITIPVFPLASLCMRSIHKKCSSKEIENFCMPYFLKKELLHYVDREPYTTYRPLL